MLTREEIRLLNDILSKTEYNKDGNPAEYKMKKKLSLLVEQLNIMEKAQNDAAKVQDEIIALEGDNNDKKGN